jgi:hypothetical protein
VKPPRKRERDSDFRYREVGSFDHQSRWRRRALKTPYALLIFSLGLAVDAVGGHRSSKQTSLGDVLTADDTLAVVTFFDPTDGLTNLIDELSLTIFHLQGEVPNGLVGSEIDGIGKVLLLADQFSHARLGLSNQRLESLVEKIPKEFQTLSLHHIYLEKRNIPFQDGGF